MKIPYWYSKSETNKQKVSPVLESVLLKHISSHIKFSRALEFIKCQMGHSGGFEF